MCLKAQAVFWALKRNDFMHRFYCCNRGLFAGGINLSAQCPDEWVFEAFDERMDGNPILLSSDSFGSFPMPKSITSLQLAKDIAAKPPKLGPR